METIHQKSYRIKCAAQKYFGMNSKRAYYYGCLVQIVAARMQHPKAFCHPATFADCMKYATESTERNRNY